ncbi:Cysteine desulfurase [Indibacter alkaliphilus LW1]|uniref:Cysteine desulfurase n=1 Tax=Indibacter alkaliphilus (strain CCUG 57479 / KCTC 22604 / LW1) TaxID=1189612 RepID=S2D469_INDAL|nr:aminotransferase class V-fold PLP-dependent enzyme [Indibacter alkaliphilus]EOZ93714.1 Cysteine desulfurase [Indibacter alkaliphilus LW1]
MDKRTFLKNLALTGIASTASFKALSKTIDSYSHLSADQLALDEGFWMKIREGYRLKPDYINLENGYYCFVPQQTLENYIKHIKEINYQGSWYFRTVQWDNKDQVVAKLAKQFGGKPEEVAITRNATESLDIIISGFPWQKGDEAIYAAQDYGSIKNMFELVARRHGVVNRVVDIPNHPKSDEEIVQIYEKAIGSNTKLIMVSHMINITGQILPVKKIVDMAHSYGVEVMLDGAHCIAHFDFKIEETGCDYYACSLHKWLSVPLGAGLLYVKKDKISKIWPLLAPYELDQLTVKNISHIGTEPVATTLAINDALDYYDMIGAKRKEERLRYLQLYWTDQVRDVPGITVNTPKEPGRSCGIANVGIDKLKPAELANILMDKYSIYTVAIDGFGVHGCRITPNIYTTPRELDKFVKSLKELA